MNTSKNFDFIDSQLEELEELYNHMKYLTPHINNDGYIDFKTHCLTFVKFDTLYKSLCETKKEIESLLYHLNVPNSQYDYRDVETPYYTWFGHDWSETTSSHRVFTLQGVKLYSKYKKLNDFLLKVSDINEPKPKVLMVS